MMAGDGGALVGPVSTASRPEGVNPCVRVRPWYSQEMVFLMGSELRRRENRWCLVSPSAATSARPATGGGGERRHRGHRRGTGQRRCADGDPPPAVPLPGTGGQAGVEPLAGGRALDALAQLFPDAGVHDVPFTVVASFARCGCGSCHVAVSSRSRDSPRDVMAFTLPSEQPSSSAVSAWVSCSQQRTVVVLRYWEQLTTTVQIG